MDQPEAYVEARELRRYYLMGRTWVQALDGVSFALARGSMTAIVGRSGSGKSTLLNLLAGLDRPTHGEIRIEGQPLPLQRDVEMAAYRRRRVGLIFQSFNLIPQLTAEDNVMLPLLFDGLGRAERRERARDLLRRVGLEERVGHRPSELSGGEQQRVAIARAMVNRPAMLLADEPTGNLDSKTSAEIMALLTQMRHELGQTVLIVTHEQDIAHQFCQRVITLGDGRVLSDAAAAGGATA